MNGRGAANEQARQIDRLHRDIAERDQVIGEFTIANRIFKTLSDGSS